MKQKSNNSLIHLIFDVCFANKVKDNPDVIQKLKEIYSQANSNSPLLLPTPFLGEFLYKDENLANLFLLLNKIDSKKYSLAHTNKINTTLNTIKNHIPQIQYTATPFNATPKKAIQSPRVQTDLLNKGYIFKMDKNESNQWALFRNAVQSFTEKSLRPLKGSKFQALTEENIYAAEIEHKKCGTGQKNYPTCNKIDFQSRAIIHYAARFLIPVVFSNDQQMIKRLQNFIPVYASSQSWNKMTDSQKIETLNINDLPKQPPFLNLSAKNTGGQLIPCINVTANTQPLPPDYLKEMAQNYTNAISSALGFPIGLKTNNAKVYIPAPVLLAFRKNDWEKLSPIYKANNEDVVLDFGLKESVAFSLLMRKLNENNEFSKIPEVAEKKYYVQILATMIMNPEKPIILPEKESKNIKKFIQMLNNSHKNTNQRNPNNQKGHSR